MAGVSLGDKMRISVIREGLRVEPQLLCVKKSQLRWFGHLIKDASFSPPYRGVPGMSSWEDTQQQIQIHARLEIISLIHNSVVILYLEYSDIPGEALHSFA